MVVVPRQHRWWLVRRPRRPYDPRCRQLATRVREPPDPQRVAEPWNVVDEWYVVNRNVEAVKGFRVIANVTVKGSSLGTGPRPAVWITENANGNGGRAFYTVRGHNLSVYAEPQFRALMLRGILWAVHRLPGGA